MSEPFDVLVIGRGVAGSLAALAARRAGARVGVVAAGGGASELGSGAWDLFGSHRSGPGDERSLLEHARGHEDADAALWALGWCQAALGLALHAEGPMPLLATEAGLLRRAAAHDPAQLDLSRAPRATVVVASLAGHPSFDGPWLARALDEQASRLGQARRFVAVELDFVRRGRDRVLHPHELAAVLERDPSARPVLARAIARGLGGLPADAILLPPLLGLDGEVRGVLEAEVGLPIGEIVSGVGAVAGLRLVRRLERMLADACVPLIAARAAGIDRARGTLRVTHDGGEALAERLVLATGKHLGGGVRRDAEGSRERLMGLLGGAHVEPDGRVTGLPGALGKARVYSCGEVLASLDTDAGLVAVAASALRAGFSAAT